MFLERNAMMRLLDKTPRPVKAHMGYFLGLALDTLLPPRCQACANLVARDKALCGVCWQGLSLIDAPICDRTGAPLPFALGDKTVSLAAMHHPPKYDRARAAVHYKETGRVLVHRLKFHDMPEMADFLVGYMMRAGADVLADKPLILPVPLHFTRLWKRRYNQSAELARRLARRAGLDYAPHILRRVKPTKAQIGLTRAKRRNNLRGAFAVRGKNAIVGKQVLLIDDVMTTGATAEACAMVLRRAGAAKIDVLTFARVVRPEIVSI